MNEQMNASYLLLSPPGDLLLSHPPHTLCSILSGISSLLPIPSQMKAGISGFKGVMGSKGFPGGASGKEPTCQCRRCQRHEFDP